MVLLAAAAFSLSLFVWVYILGCAISHFLIAFYAFLMDYEERWFFLSVSSTFNYISIHLTKSYCVHST